MFNEIRNAKHVDSSRLESFSINMQQLPVTEKVRRQKSRQTALSTSGSSQDSCLVQVMTGERVYDATSMVETRPEVDMRLAYQRNPLDVWEDLKAASPCCPTPNIHQFPHDNRISGTLSGASTKGDPDSMPRSVPSQSEEQVKFLPHLEAMLQKISSRLSTLVGRVTRIESRITAIELASLNKDNAPAPFLFRHTPDGVTTAGDSCDSTVSLFHSQYIGIYIKQFMNLF